MDLFVFAFLTLFVTGVTAAENSQENMMKHEMSSMGGQMKMESRHEMMKQHSEEQEEEYSESAVGYPGRATQVSRTIRVDASDKMRFAADSWQFKAGETVRFVVTNSGYLKHEFVIGDQGKMREHAEEMAAAGEYGMKHDSPNAISLEAGETGELLWTFTDQGRFEAACNEPGHYEAGMNMALVVQ
ncbi:plastocyanin/azurin family copper-binding protein [Motiliproteus sp. MSK22-1]|uniref:cupredoxin domain-containing protein n=1 Tax=Motiliproteus sp. MSK22-1 TaxID=1897630 RepID=UPI000975D3D7|nr:cupredoxin family protein [Motiliproteus sp. MSK22-1]OMH31782.1 hypothetical protein BGP75_16845 [Motiliproteus sp. MSK22-1]